MNELIIAVNSINKSFTGQKVIDNLSFTVSRGEIVGFLGPNGSGKTTTIRLLNGVITPDSGQIRVWGIDPVVAGEEIRRHSGVMTESAGLYRGLNGFENLKFFAKVYGVNQPDARIRELLTDFGLDEFKDKKVGAYSSGMKKRLGIAKALLHSPDLLFLDEPTTGLDPEGTRDLLNYISELNRKYQMTIFLCTHLLKQVERICHRFIFIAAGQIIETGTLKEIESKYLGPVDLRVETDLAARSDYFKEYRIVGREPGNLIIRAESKSRIPQILTELLREGPVYAAEIMGRDLETLYFKVLAMVNFNRDSPGEGLFNSGNTCLNHELMNKKAKVNRHSMNYGALWAVAVKDMKAIRSNLRIWLPMLILPLIFTLILPGAMILGIRSSGAPGIGDLDQFIQVLNNLPPGTLRNTIFSWKEPIQQLIYFLVNYFFAPFFLMIPLMAASVISANSFAGEKEQQTLESLLFTPIDILSLFVGKLLASFIPAMALTLLCSVLYGIVVNLTSFSLFHRAIFPAVNWLFLILWVTPFLSLFATFVNVLISAKVKGFQEAYQLSGLVILPVLALLFSQMAGVLLLDSMVLFWIGFILLIGDWLLIKTMGRYLNRNRLVESQVG